MKIRYQADDGYITGSRPQYVEISDEDILECETKDEVETLICEAVDEDFALKVTAHIPEDVFTSAYKMWDENQKKKDTPE